MAKRAVKQLQEEVKKLLPPEVIPALEQDADWNNPELLSRFLAAVEERDRVLQQIEELKGKQVKMMVRNKELLERKIELLNQRLKLVNSTQLGGETVEGWLNRPVPKTQWDIEQLLATQTTLIIGGVSGIGKTWESEHLAFKFRQGERWHGLQCRKLTPLYITLELNDRQMQKRMAKLAQIYPTVRDIHFLAREGANYKLNTDEGKKNLFEELRKYQPFEVLILDPLSLFIKGKIEQVDWNNEIEPVLSEIKREFGCSLILNHNFRKKIQIYGHGEDNFAADRLKGVAEVIDRAGSIVVFISESQAIKKNGESQRVEIAKWIHAAKTRDAEWELKPHRVVWDWDKAMFKPEDGLEWTKAQRYTGY